MITVTWMDGQTKTWEGVPSHAVDIGIGVLEFSVAPVKSGVKQHDGIAVTVPLDGVRYIENEMELGDGA